jgi:hypothetical protein
LFSELKCSVKSKRMKSEDFIGWTSKDGNLRVVGVHGKQGQHTTFKVSCEICSPDTELFPLGYFVSTKYDLTHGVKPCGCSKKPRWSKEQCAIKIQRVCYEKGFIFHGFVDEYKGNRTKLKLECTKDGNNWDTTDILHLLSVGRGCSVCGKNLSSEKQRTSEEIAFARCKEVCKDLGYEFVGFPDGYRNARSRFKYVCPRHGIQEVNYDSFVRMKGRCNQCGSEVTAQKLKLQLSILNENCNTMCKEKGYVFIGFEEGYVKSATSKFTYLCTVHGQQKMTYSALKRGTGCKYCNIDKRKELSGFYGWYPERAEEQDFIYVLNFNDAFIKVGRSFDIDNRIKGLRTESKVPIENIYKLRIYTATHKEIYDFEQELHEELRLRGFQHYVDWSTECFENDSIFILNKLLDNCKSA